MTNTLRIISSLALFALCFAGPAQAQQPVKESPVQVNVCHAEAVVQNQSQQDRQLAIEIAVTVNDCEGICTGSVEYDLVFADADNDEVRWHLTEPWRWRSAGETIVLDISKKADAGYTLKAVDRLAIGRCSCSTSKPFGS